MFVNFVLEILFPLLIALVLIVTTLKLISMLLDMINFDLPIIRIVLFLVAYYFVGPFFYGYVHNLFDKIHPFAKFFFTPIQKIIEYIG